MPDQVSQQAMEIGSPSLEPLQADYQEGEYSRDYYVAEDSGGRRFWLFRQGLFGFASRLDWYMQGFFS